MALLVCPTSVFAAPNNALQDVYWSRADLRASFDPAKFRAVPNSHAGFLIDLDDWARQYGWREYPKELVAFAPAVLPPSKTKSKVISKLTAEKFLIIDQGSGQILASDGAGDVWPVASLTKLMTARVVREEGVDLTKSQDIIKRDDVGGTRLSVTYGERLSVGDLLLAALVTSANNAANALARSTGLSRDVFVEKMNAHASALNLSRTIFVEPTGIETKNESTAREMARIAQDAFADDAIARATSTASCSITLASTGSTKKLSATNWMLYKPEFDDVYVTAGKTGYLEESAWNLVVSLRPKAEDKKRELLVVLFGAASRADSFRDAKTLARWAWDTHTW